MHTLREREAAEEWSRKLEAGRVAIAVANDWTAPGLVAFGPLLTVEKTGCGMTTSNSPASTLW